MTVAAPDWRDASTMEANAAFGSIVWRAEVVECADTDLRVEDATLDVLATRQLALARALPRREHANQDRIGLAAVDREIDGASVVKRLRPSLDEARRRPERSRLERPGTGEIDGRRETVRERLAAILGEAFAHRSE